MQDRQIIETVFRVLVTDDEDGMRLGIERALRKYVASFNDMETKVSYDIDTAASGEEAVEKLTEGKFDILFLDYKLPGINGIEVLEKTASLNPEMLVVMISAYASLDMAVSATKNGAFDFLAKPFTPQELKATTRAVSRNLVLQQRAKTLAEEKKQLRFEFISVLSHELKAPIGAVEGYLNLIKNGSVKDQATMEKIVGRSISRLDGMRKLIFDILDLTRIESGQKKRNIIENDIVAVVRDGIELMEVQAGDRGIQIEYSGPESLSYLCDKGELDIVVNNLVSNAVKYNEADGTVKVQLVQTSDAIQLSVTDTGIGMTEKEVERLFGEFVRMKNAKTISIEGSGLGLSTVKKIVHLYDGEIKVDSKWEQGTTFTVVLPLSQQS